MPNAPRPFHPQRNKHDGRQTAVAAQSGPSNGQQTVPHASPQHAHSFPLIPTEQEMNLAHNRDDKSRGMTWTESNEARKLRLDVTHLQEHRQQSFLQRQFNRPDRRQLRKDLGKAQESTIAGIEHRMERQARVAEEIKRRDKGWHGIQRSMAIAGLGSAGAGVGALLGASGDVAAAGTTLGAQTIGAASAGGGLGRLLGAAMFAQEDVGLENIRRGQEFENLKSAPNKAPMSSPGVMAYLAKHTATGAAVGATGQAVDLAQAAAPAANVLENVSDWVGKGAAESTTQTTMKNAGQALTGVLQDRGIASGGPTTVNSLTTNAKDIVIGTTMTAGAEAAQFLAEQNVPDNASTEGSPESTNQESTSSTANQAQENPYVDIAKDVAISMVNEPLGEQLLEATTQQDGANASKSLPTQNIQRLRRGVQGQRVGEGNRSVGTVRLAAERGMKAERKGKRAQGKRSQNR